jgi:hypothetical protein
MVKTNLEQFSSWDIFHYDQTIPYIWWRESEAKQVKQKKTNKAQKENLSETIWERINFIEDERILTSISNKRNKFRIETSQTTIKKLYDFYNNRNLSRKKWERCMNTARVAQSHSFVIRINISHL